MIIELMSCLSCQRICDQFTFPVSCPRCGTNRHRKVEPTYWTITKWFLTHPRHVLKLLWADFKENSL